MKQFFKGVLIINHTKNPDQIDLEAFQELAFEKKLIKDENEFQDITKQLNEVCIQLIKQNPQNLNQFNEILNYYGFSDEKSQKELNQVWEAEKENAFNYLLKKNNNFRSLDKIEWSLNNKFYSKKQKNMNQMTTIMALKTVNHNGQQPNYINFELNQEEFDEFKKNFDEIDEKISQILN